MKQKEEGEKERSCTLFDAIQRCLFVYIQLHFIFLHPDVYGNHVIEFTISQLLFLSDSAAKVLARFYFNRERK